jgi:hypothetical protein
MISVGWLVGFAPEGHRSTNQAVNQQLIPPAMLAAI